jgi:hypothetical protein
MSVFSVLEPDGPHAHPFRAIDIAVNLEFLVGRSHTNFSWQLKICWKTNFYLADAFLDNYSNIKST